MNSQAAPASVSQTRAMLADGAMSVVSHVEATLETIRAVDPALGAFVTVAGDEALQDATRADARIRELGAVAACREQPLLGVTVAVKDLIHTSALPTSRGSLLPNPRPRADAPAVARLRAAGAIVIGKTTTSEAGWSASTVSRVAGPTANPWAPSLSAGGSSGGSAAAVAAGLCTVALGTDGAGSIRIPASFCGVVGFKPTFGRVPYLPPCSDRLAHLGPMTRSVNDAVEIINVIEGPAHGDPDSMASLPAPPHRPGPLRVAWLEYPGTCAEVREVSERAARALAGHGHHLERIDVPFPDPYPALVAILAATEAAGTSPSDEPWCDPGRLAVVRHGRTLAGADVIGAEQTRLELRVTMSAVMAKYDLLAMATVPIEPFDRQAIGPAWAADPADLSWLAWAPAMYPFNLTGQPAISLPAGVTRDRLPVGVQLVGAVGADDLVLTAAGALEAAMDPLPAGPDRSNLIRTVG